MSQPMANDIPRGIEVLVKKASVDPAFCECLLSRPDDAARQIGLELTPHESLMIRAVPAEQLKAIIDRTDVPQEQRRAFLGHAAAAMLAALSGATVAAAGGLVTGAAAGGIMPDRPAPAGIRPKTEPVPNPDSTAATERVVEIVIKTLNLKLTENPEVPPDQPKPLAIPRQKRLIDDLGAKPQQIQALFKAVEKKFQIKLSYQAAKNIKSVGDLIDHVEEQLRAKEKPGQKPPPISRGISPDIPSGTFGNRPDRPPAGGLGGSRPDIGAPPGSAR